MILAETSRVSVALFQTRLLMFENIAALTEFHQVAGGIRPVSPSSYRRSDSLILSQIGGKPTILAEGSVFYRGPAHDGGTGQWQI